jgi:hypothetical protein
VRRKAAERVAEQEARQALGHLDSRPVDDPLTALSELAGEIVAWKNALAERVAVLKSTGYAGTTGEQIRADVALYERAMDRAVVALATISKLNIDERLAAIRERQFELVSAALTGALVDAGLPDSTRAEVVTGVARRLRVVNGTR